MYMTYLSLSLYIYIYIYQTIYTYIHIYIEREREMASMAPARPASPRGKATQAQGLYHLILSILML